MTKDSSLEIDHVQKHLRRHDEHVRRDAVAGHAILAFFDRLVEAQLLLLRNRVHHHLVVHRGADVALGAPEQERAWRVSTPSGY